MGEEGGDCPEPSHFTKHPRYTHVHVLSSCFSLTPQVLLTSDPTTDIAAASMNIHAGHFQDPEEFAGLAHFHEHM